MVGAWLLTAASFPLSLPPSASPSLSLSLSFFFSPWQAASAVSQQHGDRQWGCSGGTGIVGSYWEPRQSWQVGQPVSCPRPEHCTASLCEPAREGHSYMSSHLGWVFLLLQYKEIWDKVWGACVRACVCTCRLTRGNTTVLMAKEYRPV